MKKLAVMSLTVTDNRQGTYYAKNYTNDADCFFIFLQK